MNGEIISIKEVARETFELLLSARLPTSKAGQFVMVRVRDSIVPLLRRPMSIAGYDDGKLRLIFKKFGQGTEILSRLSVGDRLDVSRPYGNFFAPPEGKEVILVGGGVGIPPLLNYANSNPDAKPIVVVGGASKDNIFGVEEFKKTAKEIIITTVNGSLGIEGLLTKPLSSILKSHANAYIIACGPLLMLKAIDELCTKLKVDGELSMEEQMGCGFGVCLGCMIETGNGRQRVCVEGPVFKIGSIRWK